MFKPHRSTGTISLGFEFLELLFHSTVRSVRKGHGNAVIGLVMNILQTLVMVGVFYFMMTMIGLRQIAIRGDFLLYIMSGVLLFMTHVKAVSAVMGAEGPTSAMMKHAPMNTMVAVASSAFAALYQQILSMAVVLYIYHAAFTPIEIEDPAGAVGMVLLSWFTGVSIGMVFLALQPWIPDVVNLASLLYRRASMFASGKMFLANTLGAKMLALFDWHPLFHTIDQARGFTFINYNPHFSSISYPVYVGLTFLMLGLMGEFYTRRNASLSWGARR
ncbi:ABC transporter permease [Candidatus Falkowbacteria bacterium]|nr:ABC transporter permease [Candidatus Falkowbacteria bacterium]